MSDRKASKFVQAENMLLYRLELKLQMILIKDRAQ